ncbi:MAG: serine/threonine-protein kinase [Terracidiphilus sp.]|jgi:serine/threonine-protein kinase
MNFPETIGRYEIQEELGRGAMGSVFKARDPIVGRIVAIKTIHSTALEGAQSEEYRARFKREARASGVLAHPGIVPVFDVGEHEGAPFLVMEYVDGRTLNDVIKKGERYTLDRACEIGQQIAEALGYAHRQGVIHRDIKPANILMTSREVYGSERPRITDFGIAKLMASELTTTGQMLGTPSFMPPEQFTGAPIDGRADLFSLGVILYALATGEQPFPGETMTAVSYKVVHTEPIPPSRLNPAIPARMEAVILKALAKSPADRYQTGEELAQDLAALRTGATPSVMQSMAAPAAGSDLTLGPAATPSSIPPGFSAASLATSLQPGQAGAVASGAQATAKKAAKPARAESVLGVALLSVAGLAVIAAGGWFWFQHHKQAAPAPQQTATAPAPQPAAPAVQPETAIPTVQGQPAAAPAGAAATPAAKPSPAKPASGTPQPAAPATPAPAAKPGTTPQPPAGAQPAASTPAPGFDPRKADPNQNAKLKIDVSRFPNGLAFTINMNRQPYLQFVTGDGTSLDNLYVPAGVQTFRVSLRSAGQEWDSNIVSDDFKAKKQKTLKLQMMEKGKAQAKVTLPIGKDAQLFASFSSGFLNF